MSDGSSGRRDRARRCGRDAADRDPLPRVQQLGEQRAARERADHRFQALQHPDRARRQPAQRGEVERVGEHRRQHGDEQPDGQRRRLQQGGAGRRDPERERDEGRPRHGEREDAAVRGARAAAEQQVATHGHARAEREQHAVDGQRTAPAADEEHAGTGQQRPRGVEGAPGSGERHRERAEEQQRHRDTEREVPHGGVDEVHPGDRGAERHDEAGRAEVGRRPGPQDGEQDERREPEPQRHDPGGRQQVERPLPDRLPDLDADHAGEHEERGAGHASTVRPDSVNVQLRF